MAEERQKYPNNFIKETKKEYPKYPELHRALDSGAESVGRYLDDNSFINISPDEIIKMIDLGKEKLLREKAKKIVHRRKLYNKWLYICQKMFC